MNFLPNNEASRRYTRRFLISMVWYLLLSFSTIWALSRFHPSGALAYALAALPAMPTVAVIAIVGLYLAEEKDEFQRDMLVQAMLWALGATLATTTVWGFLEALLHVRHLQPYFVFPLFWFFVGLVTPVLKWRYR